MELQEIAQAFYAAFERRTRDDDSTFYCLKDDAPEWMSDSIAYIHGTDIFPDDWRYSTIHTIAGDLADLDDWEDAAYEIADGSVDYGNGQLLAWAMSDLSRAHTADEIAKEYGNEAGIYKRLQYAQQREAEEIAYRVIEVLQERFDELESG